MAAAADDGEAVNVVVRLRPLSIQEREQVDCSVSVSNPVVLTIVAAQKQQVVWDRLANSVIHKSKLGIGASPMKPLSMSAGPTTPRLPTSYTFGNFVSDCKDRDMN
jgi:hypothetical protein